MKLPYLTIKTAPFCAVTLMVFKPTQGYQLDDGRWMFSCIYCDSAGRKVWQSGYDASQPGQHVWDLVAREAVVKA